jgi:hydrogenase/urease accessory protein HupE
LVEVRFRCPSDLRRLRLDSTLFHDEETPHDLIGTFRHRFAVERYLFSRGEHTAVIEIDKLQQAGPAAASVSAGVRIARPPPGAFAPIPAPAPPMDRGVLVFVRQGVLHILGGLDHILLVLSLVLTIESWRRLALVISAFTLAHSVTLVLSALGLLRMAPEFVEPLIALSVMYLAIENIVRKSSPRARLGVTFGFGLVHGLGFGRVLSDLGLSRAELTLPLLGFNLGVELGQLALVAPLVPALFWLRRQERAYRMTRLCTSTAIALVAWVWFVERVFIL